MVLENLNSHMQMNIPQTINLHYIQKSTHSWLKMNIRPETTQLLKKTQAVKSLTLALTIFFKSDTKSKDKKANLKSETHLTLRLADEGLRTCLSPSIKCNLKMHGFFCFVTWY